MIIEAANYFICSENCKVSHKYLKQFLKCNPKYHLQKQKLLAAEQKHNHNVSYMSDYLRKFYIL